jgi:hypothetical protein
MYTNYTSLSEETCVEPSDSIMYFAALTCFDGKRIGKPQNKIGRAAKNLD